MIVKARSRRSPSPAPGAGWGAISPFCRPDPGPAHPCGAIRGQDNFCPRPKAEFRSSGLHNCQGSPGSPSWEREGGRAQRSFPQGLWKAAGNPMDAGFLRGWSQGDFIGTDNPATRLVRSRAEGAGRPALGVLQKDPGIHSGVVEAQGPVQVGAGGAPRLAHFPQEITRLEHLPLLHGDLR